MITLLLATRNAHKAAEIRAMLKKEFQLLTLKNFPGAPKTIEDEKTFSGNAAKKAIELARWIQSSEFQVPGSELKISENFFALADDSGLKVDALEGAPGIFSARFAALDRSAGDSSANSSDADNNVKLLRLLKNVPIEKRTAQFVCALALAEIPARTIENSSPVCFAPENEFEISAKIFEGVCSGKIIFGPGGQNGFGYDPLFVPDGFEKTFAELGDDVKNKISHRAKAMENLIDHFTAR